MVFLSIDCPISQKYVSRLNNLFIEFHDSVAWYGYVPQNVSDASITQFINEFGVEFPLTRDKNLSAARKYNASVTPEVIVINKDEKKIYRGAIDNWFYDLGKYRPQATEFYLKDAIEALLSNNEPRVSNTVPIGCYIQKK